MLRPGGPSAGGGLRLVPGSVFKTVVGLNKVPGGFDSHPPPPFLEAVTLDANYLFASLMWGSVGIAYFIYGKKQMCMSALIGGIVMVAVSYLIGSALWMSVACLAIVGTVYWLAKQGY